MSQEYRMKDRLNIAIDGLSGCGKSTLAKGLARHYGIIYVDTGALYRTVGLCMIKKGIASDDEKAIVDSLPEVDISVRLNDGGAEVLLAGVPVGDEIRTPLASKYASDVSRIPEVRAFLLDTQRRLAAENSCVMDGRDIGTVIMPSADVKIYLTAGDGERAVRRRDELAEKGVPAKLDEIREALMKRDANDMNRTAAPAVAAPDAVKLDNSGFTKEQTLAAAIAIIDKAVMK